LLGIGRAIQEQLPCELLGHTIRKLLKLVQYAAIAHGVRVEGTHGLTGDDEKHHRYVHLLPTQFRIEASESLQAQVEALVVGFEAPAREEEQRIVQVERIAWKEVAHDETPNAFLVRRMVRLEVVPDVVSFGVDAVGSDDVRSSPEKVQTLFPCDWRDRGEDGAQL